MDPEFQESMFAQIRREATPVACRRFGLTLLVGLPLAGFVWLLILRITTGGWMWSVPAAFGLAALLLGGGALGFPGWSRRLFVGWHVAARAIELGLTWLLLFIFFWLVITPVGLVRRRRSSGFLRGPVPGRNSYWHEVPPVKDPSRYYRQF